MADPRTKEELLQEIESTASENESYKECKTSLAELNQDIDKLMKPGKKRRLLQIIVRQWRRSYVPSCRTPTALQQDSRQ